MRELSILIPARNEEFLAQTVKDILDHREADTEIIVVLDGEWANPPLVQDERVRIIKLNESIGQRAAQNLACRLSRAKYVMKVDAHCSFDQGFDRKMLEGFKKLGDDVTMVPIMRNLHAFDWACKNGHRRYQSPSGQCKECGGPTTKELVWKAKRSPESTSYKFDKELEFGYFGEYKKHQKGDFVETMSLQGSCFMSTREKYWEIELCDESWGNWGGQGAEVALKTWLSGGRVVCNKKTWYAHMFRTQGGDFGFPYPNPGNKQKETKDRLRETFLNDNWSKATKKLQWLVDKFNPPDWKKESNKGIVYYTDNQLKVNIAKRCQLQLENVGLPITSASLKPMPHFGDNIYLPLERGYITMFTQILLALKKCTADIVFMCEHDVLYDPSHFDFTPPKKDVIYYNTNVWKVDNATGKAVRTKDCRQVSGICAYRETLIKHYSERLKKIEKMGFSRNMGFEAGTHGRKERVDDLTSETWESESPNYDIRHEGNLTQTKWNKKDYRNKKYTEGWQEKQLDWRTL